MYTQSTLVITNSVSTKIQSQTPIHFQSGEWALTPDRKKEINVPVKQRPLLRIFFTVSTLLKTK